MAQADSAVGRWREMVEAHKRQTERLRDPGWRPNPAFSPPSVESFRADRGREDDHRVLDALLALVDAQSTVVDVGAGAGRFAVPLARRVARVIAVEPSEPMRAALEADARRAGLRNIELVPTRWEDTRDISGDLVFAAHVVYPMAAIEPFVRALDAAARRSAAMVVFEAPPLSWLSGFWPRVHGEERLPPPHLPQLVDVVHEAGFVSVHVDLIDVEPFDLGPPDIARQKLRRRLYVAPGSDADGRLEAGMRELLEERDGILVPRVAAPIRVGLLRWTPTGRPS